MKQSVQFPPLRRLVAESMGFEGMYKACKDYLQPILQQTAIALPLFLAFDAEKRAAILVAIVYFLLYFLSSIAFRQSHTIADWRGGDDGTARFMWWVNGAIFALLIPALWFNWYPAMIALFAVLGILQGLWRPVLIARFNAHATSNMSATILSIEAQSQSVATIVLAPLLGWTVDLVGGFWPVGVTGAVIAMVIILTGLSLNVPEKQEIHLELW
ncbi:hypothetical protein F4Y59_06110 [Candidatus Poribacteria bacterium]|nr:hypothetical protein [Candidatus Poribacteria bacterium]